MSFPSSQGALAWSPVPVPSAMPPPVLCLQKSAVGKACGPSSAEPLGPGESGCTGDPVPLTSHVQRSCNSPLVRLTRFLLASSNVVDSAQPEPPRTTASCCFPQPSPGPPFRGCWSRLEPEPSACLLADAAASAPAPVPAPAAHTLTRTIISTSRSCLSVCLSVR